REHGISSATFYKWRSQFGDMEVSMVGRMKELEEENRRLKKMYAEAQLSTDLLRQALSKKWLGHLSAGRSSEGQLKAGERASGMPAKPSRSARPATATRPRQARKTPGSPTGWCA